MSDKENLREYNLEFISDEDLFNHVLNTVEKYSFKINLKKFNSNLIDPVKLTFDSIVYNQTIEETIENEVLRQLDKTNSNLIGYFHQNIFKYFSDDWKVPSAGYDVENESQKIYVEMKNKHNTMNSSSSAKTYMRFQNTILNDSEASCYLVEVIAKRSQNIPWVVTLDKVKQPSHERIRRVSIDKFYEIVTGDPLAFQKLCIVLPTVIQDAVDSLQNRDRQNTVFEELNEISSDLLTSIYLLSFKRYEGFSNFQLTDLKKNSKFLNEFEVSNLLDVPIDRLRVWANNGKLLPLNPSSDNAEFRYLQDDLLKFDIAKEVLESNWQEFIQITPNRKYTSIELFAGAGGMALGMERAGINHVMLNEIEKNACATLRANRPDWNVIEGDIQELDFADYVNQIDIVTGGFPCQAFSHAGKGLGFEDTRGTLFFDFARCINQVRPKIFIGENVKGLLNHDKGKTLATIKEAIKDIGYTLIEPRILKAMYYKVPQKRERLFLVGVRNDLAHQIQKFRFPEKYHRVLTVKDALCQGELYDCDVPKSLGVEYPKRKREIMEQVPEGGYWRDLPDELQREYMGGSYFLGGGKTGLARRLSMQAPSLTLVCSPAMKQTERCHPIETRPLTVRESARIQTFPDSWTFKGAKGQQYKQIGNAVPVNLAYSMGLSVVDFLNRIDV